MQQQENGTMCHFVWNQSRNVDSSTLVYICLQSSSDSSTLVYIRLHSSAMRLHSSTLVYNRPVTCVFFRIDP